MEDGFLGLPLEVLGTDGIGYRIEPFEATVEKVEALWEEAGKYSFLFSEFTQHDRLGFINYFLQPGVIITSLKLVEDGQEVGIFYADRLRPEHSARVHYFFTDKIQRTREPVILAVLNWFMQAFNLQRVDIEAPWFAYAALRRLHAMKIRPEGIRRACIKHNGRWSNQILFGVLENELTPEVIKQGHLEEHHLDHWFELLENEPEFARAILKRA